ncbi:UNVERIFIED_CONTAM: putative disease resistance protein RGA4 [Sesamum calycinum]|uniref:Disease resistance protein RGA4 n=1 Tax=Sesamum calycinum TaxID=2727403 RepID=A0AAW2SY69_9LAMI
MDALQVISSATQIVSSMVMAIGAIDQASRDLDDAPMRIRSLEHFVYELESLTRRIKQKHVYKLHSSQLDHQIQSLNALVDRLHPNIMKARRVVSRSKVKNFAKIIWNSVIGDPLAKILNSMKHDLNWWLESQILTEQVENVIETTARNIPIRLKVSSDQGYPISSKCAYVRNLLAGSSPRRVILIVGLSGIGKSCLARQVASDLPPNFVDGAVELGFGQYCSRTACHGDKEEYQRRLARKLCKFLVQIGFWKKINDESCRDLEYVSCMLQEALYGKRILILLEDVWEQDIVERFAKLYDNDCRYLVTTRNESVYEITEADKVELGKDDIREISKTVLLYHSLLREDELPEVAETLLERCGHHPLTVAVMGKALRKELRPEKWEKAIANLSMYATCAPGPISYVNEKEAENTVTIFGSLEFSLEAMPTDSKRLFTALAALSWVEPIPETCLEALWSVLGQESLFSLTVCKLIEGSLLRKDDPDSLYQIHDMVSLYLDGKTNDSVRMLLTDSCSEENAFISPWLFIFGKEPVKRVSKQQIEVSLTHLQEKQAVATLEAIAQALEVGISISEFEDSRVGFCKMLGPKIARIILDGSEDLVSVSAITITNLFTKADYSEYVTSIETRSSR